MRGSVANAKPKYPPDASGGYNNITYNIDLDCVSNVDNVDLFQAA